MTTKAAVQKKNIAIHVSLDQDLKDDLEHLAKCRGMSVSQLIRVWIRNEMAYYPMVEGAAE